MGQPSPSNRAVLAGTHDHVFKGPWRRAFYDPRGSQPGIAGSVLVSRTIGLGLVRARLKVAAAAWFFCARHKIGRAPWRERVWFGVVRVESENEFHWLLVFA